MTVLERPTDQMLPECHAMIGFALAEGKMVPPRISERLGQADLALYCLNNKQPQPEGGPKDMPTSYPDCASILAEVHARLSEVISPALPRTVLLLQEQIQTCKNRIFLGPVPLVRQMMGMSILSMFLLLEVSLSVYVNGDPESFDFLKSNGIKLFYNYLFLLAAAAWGASFAALFQTNQFIQSGTFDPKFNQSYWNRYLLGIMAGLIMAFFIPIENYTAADSNLRGLGKPLIATLGGFSSSAVHRILSRMVSTMESFFKGDPKLNMKTVQDKAAASMQQDKINSRMDITSKLSNLQSLMDANTSPELKAALGNIQDDLYSESGCMVLADDNPEPPPPGTAPKEQQSTVETAGEGGAK